MVMSSEHPLFGAPHFKPTTFDIRASHPGAFGKTGDTIKDGTPPIGQHAAPLRCNIPIRHADQPADTRLVQAE